MRKRTDSRRKEEGLHFANLKKYGIVLAEPLPTISTRTVQEPKMSAILLSIFHVGNQSSAIQKTTSRNLSRNLNFKKNLV